MAKIVLRDSSILEVKQDLYFLVLTYSNSDEYMILTRLDGDDVVVVKSSILYWHE